MPKVNKTKSGKLFLYLPTDMVASMKLKEADELDIVKQGDSYTITKRPVQIAAPAAKSSAPQATPWMPALTAMEIQVLKKMDTLRYNERTKEKVNALLNPDERKVLADMLKKRFVTLFKKQGDADFKYSIPKTIYDSFLMRKKAVVEKKAAEEKPQARPVEQKPKRWEQTIKAENAYLTGLEANGYLVIGSETEASAASAALEESVRRGIVVGIRSFNKKFYIATKAFITKSLPKIGKMIGPKGTSVSEISKETGIDEDGVRAVLYIMADNGDVTEIRKDIFKAA